MSRSATPATRNEATTRLKPPKRTTSAELPIGTAIWSSHGRLRTAANGCARERNVERTHPQPPDPQSETGTLATHSGKNTKGKEETLNNNIKTITADNECWDVPVSPFYYFFPCIIDDFPINTSIQATGISQLAMLHWSVYRIPLQSPI